LPGPSACSGQPGSTRLPCERVSTTIRENVTCPRSDAISSWPAPPSRWPPRAPQVLAEPAGPDIPFKFYEKGDVRIRYQDVGTGFPLLCIPGGGLNSRISNWPSAVINARDELKSGFRCITMDQRNATNGESAGPVPVDDPWGAFADDQLSLMDHLGIRQFVFFGNCIGGPFGLKLMERAPHRVVAAVLSQPVGHRPESPDVMYDLSRDVWGKEFRERRPDVSAETIGSYLHNLYRIRPDFVYSVSREFVKNCPTPMLVLPDDVPAHPYQVAVEIARLAPNADFAVYPWKEPPELKARTINRVRSFLKAHQTLAAAN
jgi:pimeloyl-ACP methyl ester carboxylesterase